jgi:hypothetical protein
MEVLFLQVSFCLLVVVCCSLHLLSVGGPYFCALANLEIALSACMTDPSLIDMDALVESARVYASNGDIDELDGLRGDQVFVYSGMKDTVVHTGVVKKTEEFYKAMKTNVSAEYSISSEHCQPTTNFGNNCSVLGEPFINICAYDGAGIALSHLVGKMNPRGVYNPANLITIEVFFACYYYIFLILILQKQSKISTILLDGLLFPVLLSSRLFTCRRRVRTTHPVAFTLLLTVVINDTNLLVCNM